MVYDVVMFMSISLINFCRGRKKISNREIVKVSPLAITEKEDDDNL
jgi:hypothetical protein